MKIVYTTIYERKISAILTPLEREAVENDIANNPTLYPVIPGTGGIRKARAARSNKGKRGGVRIAFYFWQMESTIFMLTAYAKSDQEDLSASEKKQTKALVNALKKNAKE
jgi:mRNA-degrading endonuclease RelE of RelBE toxin-antitoxin system